MHAPIPESSDFAVVGSGIAGIVFALYVADSARVTVFTKKDQSESNTNYAQGGIASVLDPSDSPEDHISDTEIAGAGLCHRDSVEILVNEGPAMIHKLGQWGVEFCHGQDSSSFDLGMEGGHSHRRIVHCKDKTGKEVEHTLLNALRDHPNARIVEHCCVTDLEVRNTPEGREVRGVWYLDSDDSSQLHFHPARAVLLATGGVGQVYRNTTNPSIATGDGVAMAYRAGATITNMEFIQFHPTAFYSPDGTSFLVSEAVRGEGGILKTLDGEPFVNNYDSRGCLAPRDVVARAIDSEMKQRGDAHVLLDITHRNTEFLNKRFPYISGRCMEMGYDMAYRPIPVVPAAHYSCGGVETDTWGRCEIPGLYAAGEVSHTGVHGANRLASNSLLEALVWGKRAAECCLKERMDHQIPQALEGRRFNESRDRLAAVHWVHTRGAMRQLMWDYVSIVRSEERLQFARRRLAVMQSEVDYYVDLGLGIVEVLELRNLVQVARLIVESALYRKENRGLHYLLENVDKPQQSPPVDTKIRMNPFSIES
jgi:L-aspartate oxidase